MPSLLACLWWGRPEGRWRPHLWAGSDMRWDGYGSSLDIFGFCIVNGYAGFGPGNVGKLILDLHFILTTFFFTCSSFFQAAGEPFAVSFNILHRSDSA